jgi:hypothetical protein
LTVSLLNPIHRRFLLFIAAFVLCLATAQTGKAVGVNNPGFETGTFSSWTIQASNPTPTISSSIVHSGTKSANVGSPIGVPEANGDSSFYQTVNVPANVDKLSFWYYPRSQDSITFNWQDAYITDTSGNILATIMHICSNSQTWTRVNYNMASYAGQTVRIMFLVHSDGFGDPTDMFVDDVTLIAPTAAGITITGRALTSNGIGISNAVIQLTDSQGNEKSVKTSTSGYYTFEDVPAGQTYAITASAKRYTFEQPTQVLNVSDNLTDVNFTANPF